MYSYWSGTALTFSGIYDHHTKGAVHNYCAASINHLPRENNISGTELDVTVAFLTGARVYKY